MVNARSAAHSMSPDSRSTQGRVGVVASGTKVLFLAPLPADVRSLARVPAVADAAPRQPALSRLRIAARACGRAAMYVVQALALWHARVHERRMLAQLDDHLRRDIGLSGVDVWREINKPFWRP